MALFALLMANAVTAGHPKERTQQIITSTAEHKDLSEDDANPFNNMDIASLQQDGPIYDGDSLGIRKEIQAMRRGKKEEAANRELEAAMRGLEAAKRGLEAAKRAAKGARGISEYQRNPNYAMKSTDWNDW